MLLKLVEGQEPLSQLWAVIWYRAWKAQEPEYLQNGSCVYTLRNPNLAM